MKEANSAVQIDRSIGDFAYPEVHVRDAGAGLSEKTIHYISDVKEDPDWVREFRLRGLKTFLEKPLPTHWASKDLEAIDFDKIRYYLAPGTGAKRSWDEVPEDIKRTFERLGIPEQERKFLAGVEAQFDSEAVYSNIKKAVGEQGVIFVGSTEGLKNHPEIFRKWFGKVIPIGDNKFSALNSAVFSGGSFIYVPPGVKVKHPLQAYFRINAENFGQFERTLIIADEGSEVTYMEGCTAPKFNTTTLHSFQPGDETRPRPRRCPGKMDRLQHRFASHHEISRRDYERTQSARRSAFHRARERRPASRHRRKDDSCC